MKMVPFMVLKDLLEVELVVALCRDVGSGSRNFNFFIKGDNTTFGKIWAGGGGGPSGTTHPARSVSCNYTAVTYSYRGAFVKARCTHYPTAPWFY